MIKKLSLVIAVIATASLLLSFTNIALATKDCSGDKNQTVLGFPTWYKGLVDNNCELKEVKDLGGFVGIIIANIGGMVTRAVGIAAVLFIIIGGLKYMTAQGDPGMVGAAKKTITHAVIGLVVALLADLAINGLKSLFGVKDNPAAVLPNQVAISDDLLKTVITNTMTVSVVLAVIIISYAGLMYVLAAGNEDKIKKAKSTIFYTVIGLLFISMSYAIVNFVNSNLANTGDAKDLAKKIIDLIAMLTIMAAVAMIVYAGYVLSTSANDSGKIATAKKTIIGSVIGILIVVMAYAIVKEIVNRLL